MAIRNVLKEGDELLRKRSKPVTVFDERLATLLDDMKETMQHENGAGIAAPQVGVLRRAVIIDYEGETTELINPVISNTEGIAIAAEGCLSVDSSKNCEVARPYKLTCTAQDRQGKTVVLEAEGWKARIICHEVDHLDGILFIDKKYQKPDSAETAKSMSKAAQSNSAKLSNNSKAQVGGGVKPSINNNVQASGRKEQTNSNAKAYNNQTQAISSTKHVGSGSKGEKLEGDKQA